MRHRVRDNPHAGNSRHSFAFWPESVPWCGEGFCAPQVHRHLLPVLHRHAAGRRARADQERQVRAALARLGICGFEIIVIYDEAESGTKTDRDGFRQLRDMVARGEVAVLAVDDQSRLTRAENAYAFIQDLVFAGGRFVSTGEGIDTAAGGWELKVQVLQLHHGQTVRDLQTRVYRGQEGRVRADGSAGDFPYGYESYYLDADWAAELARRGPKPKKGLQVCEDEGSGCGGCSTGSSRAARSAGSPAN